MFKKKKAVTIVMTAMLGVSGIVGSMIRNDVGAMLRSNPVVDNDYILPNWYLVGEEEQHYLDMLRSGAISDIDAQIYTLNGDNNFDNDDEEFSGRSTLLILASCNGWLQLAKELLLRGADATLVNNCDRSAVVVAAWHGNIEMLHLLHHYRAKDIEAHINDGCIYGAETALSEAINYGAGLDTVSLLVEWGADVTSNTEHTSIGAAMGWMGCDLDVIRFLLDHGADPDGVYASEPRSLQSAYEHFLPEKAYDVMKLLLERGADTTKYSNLLGKAMIDGERRIVDLLRAHGVIEPIECAIRIDRADAARVQFLLDKGAAPNYKKSRIPLLFAAYDSYEENDNERYKVMEVLLKAGAKLTFQEKVILFACIIENGDNNIKDLLEKYGITPTPEAPEASEAYKEQQEVIRTSFERATEIATKLQSDSNAIE